MLDDDEKEYWDAFWEKQQSTDWTATAGTCASAEFVKLHVSKHTSAAELTDPLFPSGRALDFRWSLPREYVSGTVEQPAEGAQEEDDTDPYGIRRLDEAWQHVRTTRGNPRPTVDADALTIGKYVVVLAPEEDDFSFDVDGQPLWMGQVSC